MGDRFNTISMMVLGAAIVALGGTIVTGEMFHAERPEKMGYIVEGVEEESADSGAVADPPIALRLQTADVAKGGDQFKKCASCHTITQGGANGIGPNLWATMGKPYGSHAGFAYSDALKAMGRTWTFEEMDAWLKKPSAHIKGTKMSYAGLSNAQDRASLIAYLNAQGSNLPLPAAPAAAPAAAEAPGGQTGDSATPPGGPGTQPGGTPGNTSAPAAVPNQ